MLVINDKIISRTDLCKKFDVDIDRIKKRPEFEGLKSWTDHSNGGKKRFNAGSSVLARILVEDKNSELPLEIRYALSRRKNKDNDDYDYSPVRVTFEGEGMQLSEDLDLAVFAYLHPTNALSPFHKKGDKSSFEFVDSTARATKRINDLDALGEAIVHAKTISGEDARILAKGLGIAGIEHKEDREVSAELMDFASKNPAVYLQKKSQRITMIEGQIEHFIDKGIFKQDTIGETRRWSWAAGQRTGETILDIYNVTQNARESLKNHILSDLNNYMFLLNNMKDSISARDKAIRDLETIPDTQTGEMIGNSLPQHLKNIGSGGVLPTDFNSAKEYLLAKTGKSFAPKVLAALYKGVNDKSITDENIAEWMSENCGLEMA